MSRWPTEYDDVDERTWQRAQRNHDLETWSDAVVTMPFTALFFGGSVTALAVTLLTGSLLGG